MRGVASHLPPVTAAPAALSHPYPDTAFQAAAQSQAPSHHSWRGMLNHFSTGPRRPDQRRAVVLWRDRGPGRLDAAAVGAGARQATDNRQPAALPGQGGGRRGGGAVVRCGFKQPPHCYHRPHRPLHRLHRRCEGCVRLQRSHTLPGALVTDPRPPPRPSPSLWLHAAKLLSLSGACGPTVPCWPGNPCHLPGRNAPTRALHPRTRHLAHPLLHKTAAICCTVNRRTSTQCLIRRPLPKRACHQCSSAPRQRPGAAGWVLRHSRPQPSAGKHMHIHLAKHLYIHKCDFFKERAILRSGLLQCPGHHALRWLPQWSTARPTA